MTVHPAKTQISLGIRPTWRLTRLKMSEIILTGRKTQIKTKTKQYVKKQKTDILNIWNGLYCKERIWVACWQNQQNDMSAQRRHRSAWASAQSDQSSLCTQWVTEDPMILYADSEDSDQTGRMSRLIWVLAERTCHFVYFVMRRLISPDI